MTPHLSIEERLALLEVEPNEEGRLAAQGRVGQGKPGTRRKRPGALLLAAGAVVLFALTPPGQSLAEAVGELVGVGDEPSGGPQFVNPGSTRDDTVIAVGEAPSGEPIELVETDPDQPVPGPGPEMDATCVYTNFPARAEQTNLAQCLTSAVLEKFAAGTTIQTAYTSIPGDEYPDGELMVNAYSTADVESLVLAIDGTEIEMTQGVFEPVEKGGQSSAPLRYAAGFIPPELFDYDRLRELVSAGRATAGRRPFFLDPRSAESEELAGLFVGVDVVGYDAAGTELLRQPIVEKQTDLYGFIAGLR